jgi:hypothetical protein
VSDQEQILEEAHQTYIRKLARHFARHYGLDEAKVIARVAARFRAAAEDLQRWG